MKQFFFVFICITSLYVFAQEPAKSRNGHAGIAELNISDFGAKHDGSDNAKIIQSAIQSLPETGGIIFFPSGTYKVNSTVLVNKPVHFLGAGIQRYTDQKGYDYEAGTSIVTTNDDGIILFECSIEGSLKSTFRASTFEGIGFKDGANKKNKLVALNMVNNFRIINCSFTGAKEAIVIDAGSEDASWGEIQNCIFSFNDVAINNKTSQGSVPNLHVSGGMFVVGKNQRGLVNHNGQYVRLEGFKMDILGDNATGIVWNGGTKGSISDVSIELNRNGMNTHGIQIIPEGKSIQKQILDVSLLAVSMTSDGTCGAMIDMKGNDAAYPVHGIKIIAGAFSGGTTGIDIGPFAGNNLISGCSFQGFSKSSIAIDSNSNNNVLTDIMSDRPSAKPGGIKDYSSTTIYNGYHWINGGDYGNGPVKPVSLSESERNDLKDLKIGELIFNKSSLRYEFYNGNEWVQ